MAAPLVSDAFWSLFAPLLPPRPPRPKGGRPPVEDRAALTGILFVLKSGIPWEMLPREMGCGSGMTCWRRLIPTALIGDQFRPLAAGDRGEPVGRRRQPVPGVAAGRDNGLVVRPDAMAQFVLAQVLPHVLDRVQLGAVARQRQEGEVPSR